MHCYPPTVGSAWRSQGTTNSRSSTVESPQLILARSKLHSGVVFAKRDCPHTALAAVIESRCFRRPQFWRARPGRPLSFRPGLPPVVVVVPGRPFFIDPTKPHSTGDLLGDIAILEPLRVEQHAHRASRDRQIVSPGRIWRAGRAKLVGIMDGSARGAR